MVLQFEVMKKNHMSVKEFLSLWPHAAPLESIWTAVPPVRAGSTAEEMIQCWCTAAGRQKPWTTVYNLSLVMPESHT